MRPLMQDSMITIRVPATVKEKLEARATATGVSMSTYLRRVVAENVADVALPEPKAVAQTATPSPYDVAAWSTRRTR